MRDPEVPFIRKGLLALAVVYVISPVDAIPDMIPLLGWLDDIGVLGLLFGALMRDIDDRGITH